MTFPRHASEGWHPCHQNVAPGAGMDPSLRWGDGLWGPL
jgi:hypothetical protein